jgi:hypothetical protein
MLWSIVVIFSIGINVSKQTIIRNHLLYLNMMYYQLLMFYVEYTMFQYLHVIILLSTFIYFLVMLWICQWNNSIRHVLMLL